MNDTANKEEPPKLVILEVDSRTFEALDYGSYVKILREFKEVKKEMNDKINEKPEDLQTYAVGNRIRINKLEEKIDTLTQIVLDYLDFWKNGTALKPIYGEFIERTKKLI